jgi:hypothetical protein
LVSVLVAAGDPSRLVEDAATDVVHLLGELGRADLAERAARQGTHASPEMAGLRKLRPEAAVAGPDEGLERVWGAVNEETGEANLDDIAALYRGLSGNPDR